MFLSLTVRDAIVVALLFAFSLTTSVARWQFSLQKPARLLRHDYHNLLELWSDDTRIELSVPPPEDRNSYECEVYESQINFKGCHTQCMVKASFQDIEIIDLNGPRTLSTCLEKGTHCREILISRDGLNLTASGLCDDCQCMISSYGRENYFKRLVKEAIEETKVSYAVQHSWSGRGGKETSPPPPFEVDALKLRIPAPHLRNATACEAYEMLAQPPVSSSPMRQASPPENECRRRCVINGRLGQIAVVGPPRYLSDDALMPDGTSCALLTHRTRAFIVEGLQQQVQGTCQQGICVSDKEEQQQQQQQRRQRQLFEINDSENSVDDHREQNAARRPRRRTASAAK
ncbi:hypothetical protein BIW11_06062 [Tropilaelaps mercedesae]|uniref:Uncharacterized protein n=1 Tax=Tropilaelaps mercedesae TaxID=418985 RepID=A0A1V9XZT5_9ACAR|nr:hypothetical protein BIW11_06062 [Tropilaelaps mercedesae]